MSAEHDDHQGSHATSPGDAFAEVLAAAYDRELDQCYALELVAVRVQGPSTVDLEVIRTAVLAEARGFRHEVAKVAGVRLR